MVPAAPKPAEASTGAVVIGQELCKFNAIGTVIAITSSSAAPKHLLPLGHAVHGDDSRYQLLVLKLERSEYTAPFWKLRILKPSNQVPLVSSELVKTSSGVVEIKADASLFKQTRAFSELEILEKIPSQMVVKLLVQSWQNGARRRSICDSRALPKAVPGGSSFLLREHESRS